VREYLSQGGFGFKERDFFSDPFTREELKSLIGSNDAGDFFSYRSPSFRKLGLDKNSIDQNKLVDLMVGEPRLIRRPLIFSGGEFFVGSDLKALKEKFDR
jgi:arsenate reductase-like glutaredoxin family protein